jgi:transposase
MSNFRPINRDTGYLLPPSVDERLPERHLARFVVEVIDGLDLSELVKAYRGSGTASYHPAVPLGLMCYGYATKIFSSRAIERGTYDSVTLSTSSPTIPSDMEKFQRRSNARPGSRLDKPAVRNTSREIHGSFSERPSVVTDVSIRQLKK